VCVGERVINKKENHIGGTPFGGVFSYIETHRSHMYILVNLFVSIIETRRSLMYVSF